MTRLSGPGRAARAELRSALRAPGNVDGFVSRWHRGSNGLRLHVRERVDGPTGEPACVLLHGLAVSHRYLMPTARCLRGRTVHVPDLPGFGLSDKPDVLLDAVAHAEVVADWLDRRGGRPVCVVGHSYGCQVAVELACHRPDLVAALVLAGPTVDPAAASVAGQLGRLLRDLLWEDWRQAPILLVDLRDAGLRRVFGTLRSAVRHRVAEKLPGVPAPTLLVRGARDPIVPVAWLEMAASLLPRARTLVLPGAAHNIATTAGPELALAIDTFLADGC